MSNLINNKSVSMKKATWRIFKKNGVIVNSMAAALIALSATSSFADPLPTGGNYVSGSGAIDINGNTMNVVQDTNNGIINWGSFSIDNGYTVNINNGNGATMNRVIGNNPSNIYGNLNATGSAYLINQNGIVVGPTGQVTTGGSFVASTRDISDADYNNGGENTFEGNSNAGVTIQGNVLSNGSIVLIGKTVNNSGGVSAAGDSLVGAGDRILLAESNAAGNRLFVQAGTGSITNSGTINGINAELKANGGNIYALAINNSGTVRADGLANVAGKLVLKAQGDNADIYSSGALMAGNTSVTAPKSGLIEISGKNITLENAKVVTGHKGIITMNAANGDWRTGSGTVNLNGNVDLSSDSLIINSGKDAAGKRTNFGLNTKISSSSGEFGTINLNGFDTVNLNSTQTLGSSKNNAKITTKGSVVINAKNITIDESWTVNGDFVLNAAAFDDVTNNFVPEAGKGANTLFSDGWKTNHGTLNFELGTLETGTGTYTPELSICCGVTLTSGLDANNNRVDLTSDKVNFSYNNSYNSYKWYEAKGFDVFDTTFEGGKLTVNDISNPSNNGFIKLINNYNFVDFDVKATNDILFVSFYDTFIGDFDIEAGKNLTVVVDEANPTTAGAGALKIGDLANIKAQNIAFYTSIQAQNKIAGTINGKSFTAGTEFADTDIEKWLVFFSSADPAIDGLKNPFKVYYKNAKPVTPPPSINSGVDCSVNPNQSGCENFVAFNETGKEYRVALTQDSTTPEEGALAWGNSSQVRANEFYTIKSYDYIDTNLSTAEKIQTFWYALPVQLVNIPLDGVSRVPGIQSIAEGIKGITGGFGSALDSVVVR